MTDTTDPPPSAFDPSSNDYGRASRRPAGPPPASAGAPPGAKVVKVARTRQAVPEGSPRGRRHEGDGWAEDPRRADRAERGGARVSRDPDTYLRADQGDPYVGPPVDMFDGKGWWNVFYMRRPIKPGTMPAGMVLAIMFGGMFVAMFMNADATLRKSNAKCSDCWRHEVAEAIAYTSGMLKVNGPRKAIDDFRGTGNEGGGTDSADIARQAELERAAVAGGATGSTLAGVPGVPAVPDGPVKPTVRKPVPGSPIRLWVGGDSITGAFGPALQKVASDTTLFNAVSDSRPSSGLTRPDYFNWPDHLYKDVVKGQNPDVMVVMFGANDAQPMPINGNQGYALYSPEWLQEYRQRVHNVMKSLRGFKDDRLVIWMGVPVMGPNTVKGVDKLNYIYWSEAQKFPYVQYFDTPAFLSNPDGSYTSSLPNAAGKVQLLRASDNIHLNVAGADRVAWAVLNKLSGGVDLSAAPIAQPPDKVAPPTVTERTEVPRPADWPPTADGITE